MQNDMYSDTVLNDILITGLQKFVGLSSSVLDLVEDLSLWQRLNEYTSANTGITHWVPQGSILRPMLFSLAMLPVRNIIRERGIHFHWFVYDTEL